MLARTPRWMLVVVLWVAGAQAHAQIPTDVLVLPGVGGTERRPRTIFLNRHGGRYTPTLLIGDDSSRNESSIVARAVDIPATPYDDAQWGAILECVRALYARFGATVTDVDPGDRTHIEVVYPRTPQDIGLDGEIGGIAAMYADCSVNERAVVFVFTDAVGAREYACTATAHEAGHALGLDHSRDCDDPMSYCFPVGQVFLEGPRECGEHETRRCSCGALQDTAGHLRNRLGGGTPHDGPPRVSFADLRARLLTGFHDITIAVEPDRPIRRVDLEVIGRTPVPRGIGPWTFRGIPLTPGTYELRARVTDGWGTVGEARHDVEVRDPDRWPDWDAGPGAPQPDAGPPPTYETHGGCRAAPGDSGYLALALALSGLVLGARRIARRARATRTPAIGGGSS